MGRRALSSFLSLNSCKGAVVQIHSFLPSWNPFILVQLKSIHFSPVQVHSFQSSSNPFISVQFRSSLRAPGRSTGRKNPRSLSPVQDGDYVRKYALMIPTPPSLCLYDMPMNVLLSNSSQYSCARNEIRDIGLSRGAGYSVGLVTERSRVRTPAGAAGEFSSPGSTFCADS